MEHSRTHLAHHVVPSDGEPGPVEAACPPLVGRDENRDCIDESDPGLQCCLGVVLGSGRAPHREVVHENLGSCVLQLLGDVHLRLRRDRDHPLEVPPYAVEEGPPLHLDPHGRHVRNLQRVVGRLVDRHAEVFPDLLRVDVEGRNKLDVLRRVTSDVPVGQSLVRASLGVVVEPLNQGGGAVPHACYGYLDLRQPRVPLLQVSRAPYFTVVKHVGGSAPRSRPSHRRLVQQALQERPRLFELPPAPLGYPVVLPPVL